MDKKVFYDNKESEYIINDREAIIRYKRAIKLSNINNGSILLDIGCKYALLRDLLDEMKLKVDYYGADISDEVFKKIKNFDISRFCQADVSKSLPFDEKKFDFVFALEIMEHVESPTVMLSEIRRVLKDDGYLILSVPNLYAWNEIISNIRKLPDTEGHISSFTYQIMSRLLDFNRFEIKDYCGTYSRVPFSKKFLKNRYSLLKTNNLFLTRSYIYKVQTK